MVLKHSVVAPASLQNGPLLGDAAHLALVPGAEGRRKRRHWSNDTLEKVGRRPGGPASCCAAPV